MMMRTDQGFPTQVALHLSSLSLSLFSPSQHTLFLLFKQKDTSQAEFVYGYGYLSLIFEQTSSRYEMSQMIAMQKGDLSW